MGTNENIVTRLADLLDCIVVSQSMGINMVVDIHNDDMICIEQIQFSYYDFSYKANYYRNAYHPNGELKANPKIRIVGFHITGVGSSVGDVYTSSNGDVLLLDGQPFKLNSASPRSKKR